MYIYIKYSFSTKSVTARSHITTQPTLILSLRSYPVLFIILSSGLCLPQVRVSLPRQTDRLQGRVSEQWRHKERGSPAWFELLLGETKREGRRVWKREKRVVVPLYTEDHRFFFFFCTHSDRLTLTSAGDGDRLVGCLWRSDELAPCPRKRGHSCFQ